MMFSVVLCTYNRSDLVMRAADSVLAQTCDDFELIIVDDGSTDDTPQVLAEIDDPRVTVLRRPNGGLSAARNTGIGAASGRFVIFLDDDDSVHTIWLQRLVQAVEPSTGMVSCISEKLAEDQTVFGVLEARPHEVFPDVWGVFIAGSFALDRDILDSIGGYAEEVRVSHQTELLLRALPELKSRGLTCMLVNEPLLRITRREADERPLRQPIRLFEGARYFLDNHHELLATNPPVLADYYAIAGVNAAKIGRPGEARRYLLRAALTNPSNPTHLGRLGMSIAPGLAKRASRGMSVMKRRSKETIHELSRSERVPVVLLGGAENAVACARRFTRAGLPTVVVNHEAAPSLRSRGVIAESLGVGITSESFADWLAGPGRRWSGAVVIPLSDLALAALIENYDELSSIYRLAALDPDVARAMLDKQTTVQLAAEAGIATPKQWVQQSSLGPDVLAEFKYPLVLKPRHGFELIKQAGTKHLRVADENELRASLPVMELLPSGFVINEFVPGGDGELTSYYALRGADGEVHLEFTKRVDRRCPPNKGGATFHELVDLPATAAAGRKFFDHIGLVGLGNVEFKRDARTDELKIIECNHRLTGATPLIQASGIDLAGAVYDQALGLVPIADTSGSGTLWYPVRDLISFRMSGDELTNWLRRPWRSTMPYWQLRDPAPSLYLWRRWGSRYLRNRWRRKFQSSGS